MGILTPDELSRAEEEEMDSWQFENTRQPLCPHCGHMLQDTWEYLQEDEESTVITCSKCDKKYLATMHVSVDYTTVKIP